MIYAATTQNQNWIGDLLLKPYLEATERLNRVWAGIDFHSLYYRPLSLKERLVNLLSGTVLLLPLINTVIWVFWVTVGNPEILSDSDLLHH